MTAYRQSLLASFEECPRRAMLGRQIDDDLLTGNVGASADLGSAFHAFMAEYFRTLWRQNEPNMPTQEAIECLYDVLAKGPWVLPADERDDLRWMVLGFCKYEWEPRRILPDGTDLDRDGKKLEAEILCPDGEIRTLTGTPDIVLADPPDGAIIGDAKSGRGRPKAPRDNPDAEIASGKQYLSERGHFQGDSYGLLVMRKYPAVQRTIFREFHLRSGKVREATLGRNELEHVEREIGLHLMKLDTAIREGSEGHPLWKPRPGAWCARRCPVAASCPIPAEQRGVGAIDGPERADSLAGRYVMVDGLRNHLRDALKAYHEETGAAPLVGDGTALFWREKANGKGREFGVFPVEDIPGPPPEDTTDYEALLEASVAKLREGRA